jgi:8-oxo-dGTP diphosphatase
MSTYPTRENRPPIAELQAAADVALFTFEDNDLKAVCIERQRAPQNGSLALPGGFIWEGETSLQAAQRVLAVKAGVSDVYIEQLYTFDAPDRDSRGRIISITYMALVPRDQLRFEAGPETEKPALYSVRDHPVLSFDHEKILQYGIKRLRSKLIYTNIAYSLLPARFNFAQLQQLYETVLDRPLDKRNFRKKYLSLGLIEPTNEMQSGGRHRPAQLFRFVNRRAVELSEPAM